MTAQQKSPKAVMAYLSERTSEKGRTYYAGWLGHSKLLMFKTGDVDKFDNPVWRLIVQEGDVRAGTFHKAPADDASQSVEGANPAPGASPPPFDDSISF